MNEIDEYLHENPEILEEFTQYNKALLTLLKERFEFFSKEGDVVSGYLLMRAVMGIVYITGEETKASIGAELAKAGVNITNTKGHC